jgi:hypothetical protein
MNIRDIPKTEFAIKAGVHHHDHSHTGHAHIWRHAMLRRQFIRTAAGAAGLGAVLGAAVWRPRPARTDPSPEPVPIPGGTPVLTGGFHLFAPGGSILSTPNQLPSLTSMVSSV